MSVHIIGRVPMVPGQDCWLISVGYVHEGFIGKVENSVSPDEPPRVVGYRVMIPSYMEGREPWEKIGFLDEVFARPQERHLLAAELIELADTFQSLADQYEEKSEPEPGAINRASATVRLAEHIERCECCAFHRGHMPMGFCPTGLALFKEM